QVIVERALTLLEAGSVRSPAPVIEMATDAEVRRRQTREKIGRQVDATSDVASHEGEHSAERRAGWTPPERVDADDAANSAVEPRSRDERRRSARVVHDQREILKVERLDRRTDRTRGSLQRDVSSTHRPTQSDARRIQRDAAEIAR